MNLRILSLQLIKNDTSSLIWGYSIQIPIMQEQVWAWTYTCFAKGYYIIR